MEKIKTVKDGEPCPNNIPYGYPKSRGNYCAGVLACEYCCWCRGHDFDKEETKCHIIAA